MRLMWAREGERLRVWECERKSTEELQNPQLFVFMRLPLSVSH